MSLPHAPQNILCVPFNQLFENPAIIVSISDWLGSRPSPKHAVKSITLAYFAYIVLNPELLLSPITCILPLEDVCVAVPLTLINAYSPTVKKPDDATTDVPSVK